jgi:hypothetical protein
MARRTWRPFQPTYTPGTYTRIGVQSLSDAELAKEYSRVRREATERLRSFSRSSDPALRQASVVAEKSGLYLNRAQIKAGAANAREARALMEDLLINAYGFVNAKSSSVSGFRDIQDKQIRSLQAKGYEFVNKSNLRQFGDFMDYFQSRKDAKSYGSGTVAETFNKAAKQGISPEELEKHFKFYVSQVKHGDETLAKFQRQRRR